MKQLGPYTVLDELGRGGMGAVYLARGQRGGEHVALKVLLETDPESVERFRREAEASREVEHPHLVRALAADFRPPHPWVAFEYVPGGTLRERIERDGPLPWEAAVQILSEVAEGVAAAHDRGLLHRDVKPANVLLGPEGAKLADFGLVKDFDRESLTATGSTLGTPEFLAPEQVGSQHEHLGPATDVYGLAATLYFALTGRAPFVAESTVALLTAVTSDAPTPPRRLVPAVPAWLSALCCRGLEKHPRDRYPNALAFRAALRGESQPGNRLPRVALALLAAGLAVIAVAWLLPREAATSGKVVTQESPAGDSPRPPADPAPGPPAAPWEAELEARLARGDPAGAIQVLRDQVARDPDSLAAHLQLVQLLLGVERTQEAFAEAERALERWPEDSTLLCFRGTAHEVLGRTGPAIDDFQRASALDPASPTPQLYLAEVYRREGAYEQAVAACDRALELDANSSHAYLIRSAAHRELGRALEFLVDAHRALRLGVDPTTEANVRAQLTEWEDRFLGQEVAQGLRDELHEAEVQLERAPHDPALHAARAEALAFLMRLEDSLEAIERALELDPDEPDYHARRAETLGHLGRPAQALESINAAIGLAPERTTFYVGRAVALHKLGRTAEGLSDLDRALELDPELAFAYLCRGQLRYEQERYAEAREDAERALQLGFTDATYLQRAEALLRKVRDRIGR